MKFVGPLTSGIAGLNCTLTVEHGVRPSIKSACPLALSISVLICRFPVCSVKMFGNVFVDSIVDYVSCISWLLI